MCPIHKAKLARSPGREAGTPSLSRRAYVSRGTEGGPINFHLCHCRGLVSREAGQTLPATCPPHPGDLRGGCRAA